MQATDRKSLILEIQEIITDVVDLAVKTARLKSEENEEYENVRVLLRDAFTILSDARDAAAKIETEKFHPRPYK